MCALAVGFPLAFGGTERWAIFAFEAAVLALFILHVIGMTRAGKSGTCTDFLKSVTCPRISHEIAPRISRSGENAADDKFPILLKILAAVFFAGLVIQLIPLPAPALKVVSPRAYEIHAAAFQTGEASLPWRTISLAPNLTAYELIQYACFALFAWLVFAHARSRRQIELFVICLVVSGVFQAFYGLIEHFGGTGTIFGWKNRWGAGSAFGTFVNRDHFSGFLEMMFPLCVGYLLARANFFAMGKGLTFRERVLWFGQERLQRTIILTSAAILMGIGIFFSRSRSGISVFFLTVFLMSLAISAGGGGGGARETGGAEAGLSGRLAGVRRNRRIIRTVALAVLFAVVIIGIEPIIERFSWDRIARDTRPVFYKNTVDLVRSFPVLGTGAGTYVHAYPMFEKVYIRGILERAHNDYLETLAECGIVGGGSLMALALLTLGWLFAGWLRRRDYFVRGVVLGCMAGIAAILIHGFTDFNLRIPANAVHFVALYALGIRAVKLDRRHGAGEG